MPYDTGKPNTHMSKITDIPAPNPLQPRHVWYSEVLSPKDRRDIPFTWEGV